MHHAENRKVVGHQQIRRSEVIGVRHISTGLDITAVALPFLHSPSVGVRNAAFTAIQIIDKRFQMIRKIAIIVIEIGNIGTLCGTESAVAGCSQSTVSIVGDGRDAVPIGTDSHDDLHVTTRIVDDDDLEVLIGLCGQARECCPETIGTIVCRDDDGHFRCARKGNGTLLSGSATAPHLIDGEQVHGTEVGRRGRRHIA